MSDDFTSKHIDERLEQDPTNPDLLVEAARYYYRLAMQGSQAGLQRAGAAAGALLAQDERHVEALAIYGSYLTIKVKTTRSPFRRLFYFLKAGRVLDRAVKLDPTNITARTVRGFTALVFPGFLRRAERAVVDFEYLIERKAEDPSLLPDEMMSKIYYNLGLAYSRTGQAGEARRVLGEVVSRFPESRESGRAQALLERLQMRSRQ